MTQIPLDLPAHVPTRASAPTRYDGLLKWVGSKQRSAPEIVRALPAAFGTYWEPFLGGGAVLGALRPQTAVASDALVPLVELWRAVQRDPHEVAASYGQRWHEAMAGDKVAVYKAIRERYNAAPNPADLLFLARACYGGVIRFTKDGLMNTPCGAHRPIPPEEFQRRAEDWHQRIRSVRFEHADFETMLDAARPGDLVYCDPPYADCQPTLYGAQAFSLERLFPAIARCKARGVLVALSLDGWKRSGHHACPVPVPAGLFESESVLDLGRSMLRRFQMQGQTLEAEHVADRLLRTWA